MKLSSHLISFSNIKFPTNLQEFIFTPLPLPHNPVLTDKMQNKIEEIFRSIPFSISQHFLSHEIFIQFLCSKRHTTMTITFIYCFFLLFLSFFSSQKCRRKTSCQHCCNSQQEHHKQQYDNFLSS